MTQKISAFYYIKNNKRRVLVLVVSLAMFFIASYLTMFLLSTTSETFKAILTENTQCVQYITLGGDDLEVYYSEAEEEYTKTYTELVLEKFEKIDSDIKRCEGIEEVFFAQVEYTRIDSIVGNYYIELPMVNEEQMNKLLKYMGADLLEGRLPEKENEVVLDTVLMKNQGYKLGDGLSQNENVTIVGVIDCGYYFGCGLADENKTVYTNPMICVVTDGSIKDLQMTLRKQGILLEYSVFIDIVNGEKNLKADITDVIATSTNLLSVAIIVIVAILVIIVNISYMRDRRSEWCLYASIGYGRKTIYFSILRELLFTFVIAFLSAIIVCAVLMKIMDITIITELGLRCTYFMPETLMEIVCVYVFLFALMQIPVRMEIYRIKTIDAIDDDM
ncbi:MAG: hypothetical protein K2M73_10835 [Lachnospiraceae bacterium]|nr:hypothetical protein [Lachnospiraceae bacterium]